MRTQFSMIVLAGLIGCSEKNPCDEYVDAICECNEAMCETITTSMENADADQKDQCAAALDAAKAGDDPTCELGGEDTGG